MTPDRLRSLVLLHAEMLTQAEAHDRAARRLDMDEPERADVARDDAAEARERAEALADLLEPHGVVRPDPRQMALMGLGERV